MNNTLFELAETLGINYKYLKNLVNYTDKFYYSYYIYKKTGKLRLIDAPNYEIKAIQSWILRNILEAIPINERANGFIKTRGIKTNARFHLDKAFIMCLDIKDFFHTIKFSDVYQIFTKQFNIEVAAALAKLCTFDGYLPQGGVTSPALSNIIFNDLDCEISTLYNKKNVNYSRYADDLTFSSNDFDRLKEVHPLVETILKKHSFELNEKKTRFYSGKGRLVVTGIILNSGKLTTGRARKRKVRAMLFRHIVKKEGSINLKELFGNIAFMRDIEPGYFEEAS